jgi:hypothetical protein
MDDTPAKETPGESNINKIDLSAFEAFQFGTQWTSTGAPPKEGARGSSPSERGPASGSEAGPPRRDRRPPRRPGDRPAGGFPPSGGPGENAPRERFAPRRDDRALGGAGPRGPMGGPGFGGAGAPGGGFRGPRRFGPGDEAGGRGEPRASGGPRGDWHEQGPRRPAGPPRPYVSPVFETTFYPDDHGFNAMVKAMRASCRTYELFEIARLILGKLERCVVVFKRRADEAGVVPPLFISVPDGVPFETEDEAITHALENNLDKFFATEAVDAEPPKGSFQFVNRCPITKDLLGPPNYHRYAQIVQHHYNARGIRMPFDRYKAAIEVVRDPEAVEQWLQSMRKVTRYTYRGEIAGETGVFDNLDDARAFLLRTSRDRLVRTAETARVSAKIIEVAGRTEAARALQGALEAQRRFPLDTANALRGRIRRENFHIFKRGSKGVTYVCSVRRKFRQPGQVFSDSINALIGFLDQHPLANVAELPQGFLGLPMLPPPPPPPPPAAAAEPAAGAPPPAEPAPVPPPAPEHQLAPEQKAALARLMIDLRWLVSEGYVAEYSDGRLLAHPVLAQGQTEPDEKDHDGAAAGLEAPAEVAEHQALAAEAETASAVDAPTPEPAVEPEAVPAPEPVVEAAPEAAAPAEAELTAVAQPESPPVPSESIAAAAEPPAGLPPPADPQDSGHSVGAPA